MNILLTGGSGFVGFSVAKRLKTNAGESLMLTLALRGSRQSAFPLSCRRVNIDDINNKTHWSEALKGQDCIIHAAAKAHDTKKSTSAQAAAYRTTNVGGTLNLARQAARAGVKRFIFISSIGVNGCSNESPFAPGDPPSPKDLYSLSKLEAEKGLWRVQKQTGMEIVIIRPPLVYGANAPGNFGTLVRWVSKGIPLPFGAIRNRRTLIGIDNLTDLIIRCINHPSAANKLLLAGDRNSVSTPDLLRAVGVAINKPPVLIPVPQSYLYFGARILGGSGRMNRILGSLEIDITETCRLLEWSPPYNLQEGLSRTFSSYSQNS